MLLIADVSPEEMLQRIKKERFDFPEEHWKHVSDDAKALIRALLTIDSRKRITVRLAIHCLRTNIITWTALFQPHAIHHMPSKSLIVRKVLSFYFFFRRSVCWHTRG
jgi:hypothetical protein